MLLEKLRVIHLHKANTSDSPTSLQGTRTIAADAIPGAYHLDTCQRVLWVCTQEQFEKARVAQDWTDFQILSGSSAYAFLLRVATGLESRVLGETDIFGQLKEAWRKSSSRLDSEVNFWIQKIFEDTKEIRSQHLEHLGGVSYGTLVRKFLKDRVTRGPTLLVGAGQLAQSVGPFLLNQEVWIQNRSLANARTLAQELARDYGARVRILDTAEDEAEGWRLAAQAIVCIPVDAEKDSLRIRLWREGNAADQRPRTLLHLGAQKNQSGAWAMLENAFFLDDLFELQKAQGEARSFQIGLALRACDERSKLRALGNSVSIHHGWEDLAIFA